MIVAGILLVLLNANPANGVVSSIHDAVSAAASAGLAGVVVMPDEVDRKGFGASAGGSETHPSMVIGNMPGRR